MAISKGFILFIFIFLIFLIFGGFFIFRENLKKDCVDGTLNLECSKEKPFFCQEGFLISSPERCGCFENFSVVEGECFSELMNESKIVEFPYYLNGEKKILEYPVYPGVVDYLSKLEYSIESGLGNYSRNDFEESRINEEVQRQFIIPLAVKIFNLGKNSNERLEIARTLVQLIPYKESEKKIDFYGIKAPYTRYPYEVLYENKGICGEKSQLLYMLLDFLGEDVVLFYFSEENHEGVGIECFFGRFKETKYCYIETTSLFDVGVDPSNVLNSNNGFRNFEMIKI